MKRYYEQRGHYNIACYSVPIDSELKQAALDFARQIILSDNQYSRLLPETVRDSSDASLQHKIEIQRTFIGKLGELAFLRFLEEQGKTVTADGMLDVFPGQNNVDSFDFITTAGQTVDVKTGFRTIHRRLLVNTEQFDLHPKDFYVAVKLDATDTDPTQKLVDWDGISTAQIIGYADYAYLSSHAPVADFGEGPARFLSYDRLLGIDSLLHLF